MSQRARSPVLGYNHNIRHGGRVFHVQTEDSGTGYARLYTHLFFEGTILASKKAEYDPNAPEDTVRSMMQKLHKSMMKELSHADHDERIAAFFAARGQPARLDAPGANTSGTVQPTAAADAVATAPMPAPVDPRVPEPGAVPIALAPPVGTPAPAPAVMAAVAAMPSAARAGTPGPTPVGTPGPMLTGTPAPVRVAAKPVVVVKPGTLKRPPVVLSSSADGVVVRRNVVVNVGGGAAPVTGPAAGAAAPPPASGTPAPTGPRPRAAAPVATNGDGMFVGAGAVRLPTATRGSAAPQPLASSRDIRMPWETPAPARVVPPLPAEPPPPAASAREVRMPWESAGPPVPSDSFAVVNDKGLDEVILEYLSDEPEGQ
jgi:hypothetical protein